MSHDLPCCDRCYAELEPYDKRYEVSTTVERGKKLDRPRSEEMCDACMDGCELCGLYISDADFESYGPQVYVRLRERAGKSFPHHAMCAGEWLLRTWSFDEDFSIIDATREQIAAIVREHFGMQEAA